MVPWLNWIEHLTTDQKVTGLNPVGITKVISIPRWLFFICIQTLKPDHRNHKARGSRDLMAHPINSGERKKKSYLCIMENSMLESLVSFMLPSNILSRFTIVKVESNAETLFIHLDEIASADYVNDPNIESKGFLGLTR